MTTTQTAPAVTRPGMSYYVPGVRIFKLAKKMPQNGDDKAAEELPRDVQADILQVQVTRASSGPSQYKLTLNNWYLSTAADRAQKNDDGTPFETRETIVGASGAWPRFKYNDFSLLAFGDRLRIEMRYMPDPGDTPPRIEGNNPRAWVPMVAGPITDMRFTFGASEGARLEISGEDDLSVLQDKFLETKRLDGRAELDIVTDALAKANNEGFPLRTIAKPLVTRPSFVDDKQQGLNEAIQSGQSVLDLIQKLAERLDFEVFLEFASLDDPASALQFHFEPCRAQAPPDVFRGFRLERSGGKPQDETPVLPLLDFTPTIKIVDQFSEVRVDGRHRDHLLDQPVKGRGQREIVQDELHGSGTLKSAGEVREHFFPGRVNFQRLTNQSNLDQVRADWFAKATIRRKARQFLTIDATTIGQPSLRPGQHVEIRGMRQPFDGFYYVTQVVTTYGGDGLRTKISACRPGMELPPYNVSTTKD